MVRCPGAAHRRGSPVGNQRDRLGLLVQRPPPDGDGPPALSNTPVSSWRRTYPTMSFWVPMGAWLTACTASPERSWRAGSPF